MMESVAGSGTPSGAGGYADERLSAGQSTGLKQSFSKYLRELESLGADPRATAFFDLDRTLIAGYSVAALGWEGFRCATVPRWRIALQLRVFFDYGLGLAHYLDLMRVTLNDLAGVSEREFMRLGEQALRNGLAGDIYGEGRRVIAAHKALGHAVVLITSATRAQAAPYARELGIGHLCCTELETLDGRITGAFEPCYGYSKRDAAEAFCAQRPLPLRDAWFYTDGIEDLPLLEAVGKPVVVNPKSRLAAVARTRNWPQLEFVPQVAKGRGEDRWREVIAEMRRAAQRLLSGITEKGRAAMTRRRSR